MILLNHIGYLNAKFPNLIIFAAHLKSTFTMNIEALIGQDVRNALKSLYDADIDVNSVQIQLTKKEFEGDRQ